MSTFYKKFSLFQTAIILILFAGILTFVMKESKINQKRREYEKEISELKYKCAEISEQSEKELEELKLELIKCQKR